MDIATRRSDRPGPARSPSLILGIGFGAFADGIFLHQILQWHHMLSARAGDPVNTVAGLEANTLADGAFHAAAFVLSLVGAVLALRAWKRGAPFLPWRAHLGLGLIGWGGFNLVEGIVDHHLLKLHHVRDDVVDPAPWDIGFLAISAVLVLCGWVLVRRWFPRDEHG